MYEFLADKVGGDIVVGLPCRATNEFRIQYASVINAHLYRLASQVFQLQEQQASFEDGAVQDILWREKEAQRAEDAFYDFRWLAMAYGFEVSTGIECYKDKILA